MRWARPAWALRPAELAIIVIMGLAATGIPTFIVGTLLAIISSPYYGATPENDWAGNIHPYLPDWIVPRADGDAMRWFYEGLPKGQGLPFDVWVGPLFWLLSLILTVYFACFCLVVIFRRQWVEHERLVFPLMGNAEVANRRRRAGDCAFQRVLDRRGDSPGNDPVQHHWLVLHRLP